MRGTSATPDGQTPRLQFVPTSPLPAITWTGSSDAEVELLHPTLLPLRALSGNSAHPAWVLFAWHHDTQPDQHLHRWAAASPEGPYTHLGTAPLPRPAVPTFVANHMSSGDVVWDRANQRLVSNPHGERRREAGGVDQISFLVESRDGGATWTWLDGDARVRLDVGSGEAIDNHHTGYGRLLRDLDGELATFNGEHWWIYRAQYRPPGATESLTYTPALAHAPTIAGTWRKMGEGDVAVQAFPSPTGNRTLIGFDSFLLGNDVPTVLYTTATPGYAPTTQWFNQAQSRDLAYTTPGVPVALPIIGEDSTLSAGTNLVRDPMTKQQYLVQIRYTMGVPTIEDDQVVPHVASSVVRVFKAVVA